VIVVDKGWLETLVLLAEGSRASLMHRQVQKWEHESIQRAGGGENELAGVRLQASLSTGVVGRGP